MVVNKFSSAFKEASRAYVLIFSLLIAISLIARLVLGIMQAQGAVSFLYDPPKAASSLESLSGLITALPLLSLLGLFALLGGQALSSYFSLALDMHQALKKEGSKLKTAPLLLSHLVWQLIGLLVSLVSAVIICSGFISKIQLKAILSKAGGGSSHPLMLPLLIAFIICSILMSLAVVCYSVLYAYQKSRTKTHTFSCHLSTALLSRSCIALAIILAVASQIFVSLNQADKQTGLVCIQAACGIICALAFATVLHFSSQSLLKKL